MKIEEYLTALTEQIRFKKARQQVEAEIKNHILDQAHAYEQTGIEYEAAVEMAVAEMGDPVETGMALDMIHRPVFDLRLFLMTVLFSIAGVFLMYATGALGTGAGQLARQIVFAVLGLGVIVLIYFADYSIIGKYALPIYFLMSALFFIYQKTGMQVNGSFPALKSLVYLYVPVCAGIVYRYRQKQMRGIVKSWIFIMLTAFLARGFASSSFIGFSIFIICTLLLLYAAAAGWYGADRKKAAVLLSACAAAFIAVCAYTIIFTDGFQKQRLLAFLNQESYVNEDNYLLWNVRRAFGNAGFTGNGLESLDKRLVHENTFLIVAQTVSMYGFVAGAAIIAAFALFADRALKIAKRQKNQLGRLMSASCFLVVAFNCTAGIFMNLGLCPMSALQFPFLCAGGSATIMYAVIIGLLMNCRKCELLI